MTNSVETDQTPHSVVSDKGLLGLLKSVCPSTKGKYSIFITCISEKKKTETVRSDFLCLRSKRIG